MAALGVSSAPCCASCTQAMCVVVLLCPARAIACSTFNPMAAQRGIELASEAVEVERLQFGRPRLD